MPEEQPGCSERYQKDHCRDDDPQQRVSDRSVDIEYDAVGDHDLVTSFFSFF